MRISLFLLIMLLLGFLAQSRVIIIATLLLLLINELDISSFVVYLSEYGLEIGLVFLLLAILSSLILNPLSQAQLKETLISGKGLTAVIAGLIATRFNGLGLNLLQNNPQLIIAIILGSFIGITFLGGIPVGPLTAAGLTAIILNLISLVF